MIPAAALTTGVLFAAAIYLLLSRSGQRVALGFLLLSNAVNLLVITAAGDPARRAPPLIGGPAPMVDPLPQAFLLTAIVIGLAAAGFVLALAARRYEETGSEQIDGDREEP